MAEKHDREYSRSLSRMSADNIIPSPLIDSTSAQGRVRRKPPSQRSKQKHKHFRGNHHKYSIELKVKTEAIAIAGSRDEKKDLLSRKRSTSPLPTPPPRKKPEMRLNRSSSVPLEISSPKHHQINTIEVKSPQTMEEHDKIEIIQHQPSNQRNILKENDCDHDHDREQENSHENDHSQSQSHSHSRTNSHSLSCSNRAQVEVQILTKYNKKQTFHKKRKSKAKHKQKLYDTDKEKDMGMDRGKSKAKSRDRDRPKVGHRKQSEPVPHTLGPKLAVGIDGNATFRRKSANNAQISGVQLATYNRQSVQIPVIAPDEIASPPESKLVIERTDSQKKRDLEREKHAMPMTNTMEGPNHVYAHIKGLSSNTIHPILNMPEAGGSRSRGHNPLTPSINSSLMVVSPSSIRLPTESSVSNLNLGHNKISSSNSIPPGSGSGGTGSGSNSKSKSSDKVNNHNAGAWQGIMYHKNHSSKSTNLEIPIGIPGYPYSIKYNMGNNYISKASNISMENNMDEAIGPYRYFIKGSATGTVKIHSSIEETTATKTSTGPSSMRSPDSIKLPFNGKSSTKTADSKPVKQNKKNKTPKMNSSGSGIMTIKSHNNLNVLSKRINSGSTDTSPSSSSSSTSTSESSDTSIHDTPSETIGTTKTLPKSPLEESRDNNVGINGMNGMGGVGMGMNMNMNMNMNMGMDIASPIDNGVSLKAIGHILKADNENMSDIDYMVEEPYNSDSNDDGEMSTDQEGLNDDNNNGYKTDDTIAISSMKQSQKSHDHTDNLSDNMSDNGNVNNMNMNITVNSTQASYDKIAKFHQVSGYNSAMNLYQ